jgi:cytochrome c biogenesis protein CcdA
MFIFVVSIGLADSINPVTIAVALYLASTPKPVGRLANYVAGVFAIYTVGGLVLLFGPASLLRLATHGLAPNVGHIIAIVAGSLAIVFAIVVWFRRAKLVQTGLPDRALRPGSSFALGAAMTVVDLPTAFPLFIVVGAIVHQDLPAVQEAGLLLLYCLCYVLPLVGILALRALGGERGERWLLTLRERVTRWAPTAVSVLSGVIGVVLVGFGLLGS